MALPAAQSVVCPVLIGRTSQLALLNELIVKVYGAVTAYDQGEAASSLQIVLITGEAGIGKSRLVNEICESARQHGMRILTGRCFEQDHTLPYAPLIDLLDAFCVRHSQNEIKQTIKQAAPELVKIFPELSIYLPEIVPSPIIDPEQEKRRLFQALVQFLNHVGVQSDGSETKSKDAAPLFLIMEDLHWCDDISLDFLLYLARHTTGLSTLLVGTYRTDEKYEPLERLLAELDRLRIVTELELPRLSLGETDNMLRAILKPSKPLHYDLLDTLFHYTEGNPFFIEEALKGMLESGDIFLRSGEWEHIPANELRIPRTVQVAVQRRLDVLSPAARRLISLAAVMGRRFNIGLLQQLTSQPDTDLVQQLRELSHAQLVTEETAEIYAFRHALIREAIYQDLLGRERQATHSAIATVVERNHTNDLDAYSNDLAYHFFEAGEWAKALYYAQCAGERAQSLDATRAALVQFTRALNASNKLKMPQPLALLRARGQAHQALGNLDAARADYENILQKTHASHDRQAEWQSLLDLGLAWTSHDYQRSGEYFQQALSIVRELDMPVLLAQTLNRIGNWHFLSGHPVEGRKLHEEALNIFQSKNDQRELASTLDLLGISSYGVGDLLMGGKYYEEAIQLYRQLGDRRGLIACLCAHSAQAGCYITMTAVCVPTDLTDIIHEGEEAIQIAKQMGWLPNETYALSFHAFVLGPHGEFERALDAAQKSLVIATEIEHGFFIITTLVALGALYFDLLDLEQAQQYFQQAKILAEKAQAAYVSSNVDGYLAQTYLATNEVKRAGEFLQSQLTDETPLDSEALRWLWTARAELLLKLGQPEPALALIERIISAVPHTSEGGVVPRLWLVRGHALSDLGRYPDAQKVLREALDNAQNCQLLPQIWRIQIALGQVLRMERRFSEAQEQWSAAGASIQQLASKIPQGEKRTRFVERALTMIPNPPESVRQTAKKEFGGLTARELEVALLISQGESNLDIASALVLSRRTIEVHVANIMSKLGIRTRAQIAAWVIEKGVRNKTDV